MEIIYSAQRGGFAPGRVYQNPKFFQSPDPKAKTIIVVGDYPNIVAAYEELNIEVSVVARPQDVRGRAPKSTIPEGGDPDISVPSDEELDDMNYRDLRKLALSIEPDADITSKATALAFLREHRDS